MLSFENYSVDKHEVELCYLVTKRQKTNCTFFLQIDEKVGEKLIDLNSLYCSHLLTLLSLCRRLLINYV